LCSSWRNELYYYLLFQKNHMCISMELVTAVLGDHGQRPHEDYGKILVILNSSVFRFIWKAHSKLENALQNGKSNSYCYLQKDEFYRVTVWVILTWNCDVVVLFLIIYSFVFLALSSGGYSSHWIGQWKAQVLFNPWDNCFLQKMAITNKSRVVVLNKVNI
jgi:hypothetical protein